MSLWRSCRLWDSGDQRGHAQESRRPRVRRRRIPRGREREMRPRGRVLSKDVELGMETAEQVADNDKATSLARDWETGAGPMGQRCRHGDG
ncbi:unnamed protein product [Lampetra fluviatilis]